MAKSIVPGKPVDALYKVPKIYRRMFNNRTELFNEWTRYYNEGITEDKPDPREWAWFKFGMKYLRSKAGRWYERP